MEKFFYKLESFLKTRISRRKFIQVFLWGLAIFVIQIPFLKYLFAKSTKSTGRVKRGVKGDYDVVVAEGPDPYTNTVKAVEAMGGIERFVRKGDIVVVKPNMAWDRTPEQAANTDPQVVAVLVELCYRAGAKRVNVFDVPCNDDRRVYENSGIQKAAAAKGAYVYFADHWNVVKAEFPYKSPMSGWPILRDAVMCDTFINVPVLKHHGLTGLTLSMKNLMGVCSGTRPLMHRDIGTRLVDLTDFISPDLTVIDATRVLTQHGPSGGKIEDVIAMNKVIVATDPTLADSYACTLMKKDPKSIPYLKVAMERGFGMADIDKAKIQIITT
ncbi:MAG: DUF362 domain-containing protein [Candidatus Omnitrophica bacterium]|nr:DUF362 domain-containing protein [Candidatus Omnitrophota bacterium]